MSLLALAVVFIAAVTLTPQSGSNVHHVWPFEEIGPALAHPLHMTFAVNLVGNILLFAPLGAALARVRFRPLEAALLGCATSTAIEIAQHFIPGRTSATDDILLNTMGTAIGWFLATRPRLLPSPTR